MSPERAPADDGGTRPPTALPPLPGPCARWPAEWGPLIRQLVERAGDKWTVLVVGSLQDGPLRYTELQRTVPGISQRMLTRTLHQLRRDGLITRTSHPEVPPRVEYALTPLGGTLLATVTPLIDWAGTHLDEIRAHRARFDASGTG